MDAEARSSAVPAISNCNAEHAYRHVYGGAYRHVCRHACLSAVPEYRHACRDVCKDASLMRALPHERSFRCPRPAGLTTSATVSLPPAKHTPATLLSRRQRVCQTLFVQRGFCPKRFLSKGVFVQRGFCPKRFLSKGFLSEGVFVHRGLASDVMSECFSQHPGQTVSNLSIPFVTRGSKPLAKRSCAVRQHSKELCHETTFKGAVP